MEAYEEEHIAIPEAEPKEVLRFLMDQHGLKQADLADCSPQSHISAILAGKRDISKETAKNLAKRFNVSTDIFL
jgi:HTH-type transcriptional regulator / antitoxin HigA